MSSAGSKSLPISLKSCEGPLNQPSESEHGAAVSQIEGSLLSCSNAMAKLRETLEKCHQTPKPGNPVERIRVQTKHLLFPFKKDTLEHLKPTIGEFGENLTLALSVLQLFVAVFLCFQGGSWIFQIN